MKALSPSLYTGFSPVWNILPQYDDLISIVSLGGRDASECIPERTNSGKRCTPSAGRITTWPGSWRRKGEPPYGLPFLCFLVATAEAAAPCHVLCHDRLSPLKSRILELSMPGTQGWSTVCLPIVTPLYDTSGGPPSYHLHD